MVWKEGDMHDTDTGGEKQIFGLNHNLGGLKDLLGKDKYTFTNFF